MLVSERTAQAARHFRFGPPQVLEVRGKAEPLRALELVTEQPITEGTLSGIRAPLVGRRRELELLDGDLPPRGRGGRPHLVTLYGEAGVGKSRLVGELLAGLEAARRAPRVVRGRCLAYGEGISYWPLAEMLKAYAQTLDTDAAEVARRACPRPPRPRSRRRRRRAGELAAILDREHRPRRPRRHAARARRRCEAETQLAWRSFFSALAATAPTVVVVEDVQWADAAVLELLEDVAGHAAGPLFVLCTARPELTTGGRPGEADGGASPGSRSSRSTPSESARLAELLLDERRRRARARGDRRAGGGQSVLPRGDRPHARGAAEHGGLPDTVHAALAARIDLLPADEKRALQAAAVVGRVFWPGAVAEVAALDADAVERAARPPAEPRPRAQPPRRRR